MKLTLYQRPEREEEVIIYYRSMNSRIEAIAELARETEPMLEAVWEGNSFRIHPAEVYYLDNVDGTTYAYLEDKVAKVAESLKTLELCYRKRGFFRCSKSMILNIYKIRYLKSEPGSRIRATMKNGEQVIISRKYAKELRQILKGGEADEG